MKKFVSMISAGLLLIALAAATPGQTTNITMWQVDLQHSGNNSHETILTPGNISSPGNFGLLFYQQMDGQTYGQPLIVSGVNVSGTLHNIVYVCTEHCSIYAFDGDTNVGPSANAIWHDALLPAGCVPVPQSQALGSGDISVEVGITTTPVIDTTTNTIYIVSKVQRTSDSTYHQYLYALDLATGAAKFNSPVEINPHFAGSSSDSSGGVIPFNAFREHSRAAMVLHNGVVYVSYASHSDSNPYHGEIVGFDAATLEWLPNKTFITTPNGLQGGIWQSGAGPAFDSGGNIFISIANGDYDQLNAQNGTDWGESMLKIPTTGGSLSISYANTLNWFTPNIWDHLNGADLDLGSGGLCLLPDQTGPHTHIMVGGGKGAVLYVIDRDNLGGLNTPDTAIQEIQEVGGGTGDWLFVTPSYYNGYIYYTASGGPMEQRAVGYNPVDGSYIAANPIVSNETFNNKGSGAFISSNGNTNGIVWALYGNGIRAYNAANVSGNAIFTANSTLPGNINTQNTKFSLPMVANGKLYYTAYDNANNGYLLVSGLIASGSGTPAAPDQAAATAVSSQAITLTWNDNSDNESGFSVRRSASAAGPFTQVGIPGANVTTYTDTGLAANTTYYYQILAYNGNGPSTASNVASATTFPNYNTSGLVAYLPLDETGGVTVKDATGAGHTGTINGEAGITAGLINNGVEFHGTGQATSNISVANKPDMQFTASQSFTLSAWVNPAALRGSDETIISKSADQGNAYGIWINAANQWVFRGPGGDIVGPAVTSGAWTHVAVVQDGAAGTRTLYINGVSAATGAAQAADGAGDLWIAQQNITGNFASFPGTIDEVRLYNRALAAGEITDLMSTPVLQAASVQTQGAAGAFPILIWPTATQVIEPRKGSTTGSYKLVLNFSAPVSGITAALGLQNGGSATGSVGAITYDATGKVVTIPLTGVANNQALNVRLSNVPSGASAPAGTQDIPLNILWGDANGNGIVDALDYNIVNHSHTALVNSSSFTCDLNCNGAADAADDGIVTANSGNTTGIITPTNLALFQPAAASSVNGGNTAAMAVDNNTGTRWESIQGNGADPSYFYVDLGSVCTVQTVVINWEPAAGKNYTIDVCSGDPSLPGNWTTVQTVTNNNTAGIHTYPNLNASGRYVRMYGTARDSGFGYSIFEFQVIGLAGVSNGSAPVITGGLTASGTVGNSFSYQITATNNPTSFTAGTLPGGLGINNSTGAITGIPNASGTASVPVSAINSSGTGSANLTIGISAPGPVPAITSSLTASGVANSSFTYQITASNSPTSFNATGLPNGLSVNTSTGAITGTPTGSGTSNVTISATNGNGTGQATLVITVNPPSLSPSITGLTSVNGTAGVAFSYQITATNSPTSYNATGLPDGLSVNTSTGAITGTPSAPGTSSVTISATNGNGTGQATLTITIFPPSSTPPSVTSATTLATVGVAFSYQIAATNNPTSYNSSTLPAGLGLNTSTGLITGTPSSAGNVYTTVAATNGAGTGTAMLTFVVGSATDTNLALFKPTTASSVTGGYVSANAVDNDTGTRWDSTEGDNVDPQWFYVDLGTVCIIHAVDIDWEAAAGKNYTIDVCSGDPSVAGNWTTIRTVTGNTSSGFLNYTGLNATGRYVRMYGTARVLNYGYSILEFQVWGIPGPSPAINSGTALGTVGNAFAYQIAATNNPTTFTATGLPAGLNFSATGLISGTPTASGTTAVPISAANSIATGTGTLSIGIAAAIANAPVITSAATVSGTVGVPVSFTATATNSPNAYGMAGLPSGLVFANPSSFSGEANFPGAGNVTLTATNGSGATVSTFPVVIAANADTNLALNKTATALSFTPGNPAANAFDGNTTITRWESAQQVDPEWIYVDLGQVDTIHSVVIDWENAAGKDYTIDVSNDASNWNPIQTVTGNNNGGIHAYTGLNATGRYVRMNGTARTTIYGYSIYEFQVFGVTGMPPGAPVINSVLAASGTNGAPFTYQITATNTPTNFGAFALPAGLSVDPGSGIISGTPTATGSNGVILSAANAGGVGSGTLSLSIAPPPPVITSALTATGTSGMPFTYQIVATNSPTSYDATGLPTGLGVDTNAGTISGSPSATGSSNVTIKATNATGTGTATLALQVFPPPPVVNTVQGTQTVSAGQGATFSVNATGSGTLTYQWYKNGTAIQGATDSSYTIPSTSSGDTATYSVTVTDQYGDTTTNNYDLTVNTPIPTLPLLAAALLVMIVIFAAGRHIRAKRPMAVLKD